MHYLSAAHTRFYHRFHVVWVTKYRYKVLQGPMRQRIQMEFPELRKRYWGRRFWARGYFSTTSGNVTDDIITQYLELHSSK